MDQFNDIIKPYMDIALSDKEVLKIVHGKAKIILYPQIHEFKNINQLLSPYGAAFILYESQPNYGHWCLLFKVNKNTLEFFNPYNGIPDENLDNIPKQFRIESYQNFPYLAKLMYDSDYNLTFNEYQFQEYQRNIKTCGRHCAVRLVCRNMSLKKYKKFMDKWTKKLNISYDEFVTLLTMYINKSF